MEYRNQTHFHSLNFDAIAPDLTEFHVIVLRATHKVLPDGMLHAAPESSQLVLTDGPRQESDIAPFKPKCDVIVNGQAAAPEGKPAGRFEIGLTVRREEEVLINKRLVVTGPRSWEKRAIPFTGWRLTKPEPIATLPLSYEYAYGGECKTEKKHTCFEGNLIGRGFAEKWYLNEKKIRRVPAPQFETLANPVHEFGQSYAVAGLGVTGKAWLPRRKLAGTMDEAFIKSRKPLPDDFDFAFWNAAPADQQIPWLSGGETIELLNIPITGAPGVTRFMLPEQSLCAQIVYESEEMVTMDFSIDTVIIDADQGTVTLLYRLRLPLEPSIEKVEARFLTEEGKARLMEHSREVTEITRQAKEPAYAG